MFGSTYGANLVKEKPCIIFFVLCFVCVCGWAPVSEPVQMCVSVLS